MHAHIPANIMKYQLFVSLTLLAVLVTMAMHGCTTTAKHDGYSSPDDAVSSLVKALRSGSSEQLKAVLGPGAQDIVNSGDPVEDSAHINKFLADYDQHHELRTNPDGSMTLLVGDDNWPLPIPLVRDANGWAFDVSRGKEEILARRIGRNEEETMHTLLAVVDAQRDYAAIEASDGGLPEYAQKVMSDAGKKNGLYWEVPPGEKPSPLGPLMADASDEGYKMPTPGGAPIPYHGYLYRMLRSQGPAAPGGARDYVVHGKMIGGFAMLAHPAQYGKSGIMTFIVGYDGILYERDLGTDTAQLAAKIMAYDPGPDWHVTNTSEVASKTTAP